MTHPPKLAQTIIRAVSKPSELPYIVDDLGEMYEARRRALGAARANLWYWSQVVRSLIPLVARRERMNDAVYLFRHAVRRLLREPAFTFSAIATLALGVGGSVAVFAVVNAVLLRPLPYPHADRLVIIDHHDSRTGITKENIPVGDAVDMVARQKSFDMIGAYWFTGQVSITSGDEPFFSEAVAGTPGVLGALGVRAVVGRMLDSSDAVGDQSKTIMLGYELWRDKFGSDRRVVGTSIKIGQQFVTIVGVASQGFRFRNLEPAGVIFATSLPISAPAQRTTDWEQLIARVRPGTSLETAQADLDRVARQMEGEHPATNTGTRYLAVPLRDALVGSTKTPLLLLLAAVGVVLLIACVNVANFLLARSLARQREMAVRLALGAGRGRLARQLLAENVVLALAAAVAGIVAAHWFIKAFVLLVPKDVVAPGLADVAIDERVLAFALAAAVVTTLIFGLVAMVTVRFDSAASVLVGAGRTSTSTAMRRLASGLVMAEVALAITLLVGANLILRTFSTLLSLDPGFKYDHVATMTVTLPQASYRDSVARDGFQRRAFADIKALPGVRDVGVAAVVPLTGNNFTVGLIRTDRPLAPGERPPEVGWQVASAGYFRTISIPLKSGRTFDDRDRIDSPPVVIISDALAKRYFPNEPPVGKLLKRGTGPDAPGMEIVGVVGDIRRAGLRDEPRADMYFSAEQTAGMQMTYFVRTSGDPASSIPAIQGALRGIDKRLVFRNVRTLGEVAAESVRTTKLVLWLLGVFSVAALALAAIGIYGVMSYVVRQRTREIGTRIALGATPGGIVVMIVREGTTIAGIGAAVGLGVGLAATRSLRSLLYGVSPTDPISIVAATMLLAIAVVIACVIPARRAATIDPAKTLAAE